MEFLKISLSSSFDFCLYFFFEAWLFALSCCFTSSFVIEAYTLCFVWLLRKCGQMIGNLTLVHFVKLVGRQRRKFSNKPSFV